MKKDDLNIDNHFKYYDELYEDKDYIGEANFIENLLVEFDRKPDNLLELGSGTCKLSLILAKRLSNITCVDSSETMFNYAKINLEKQPKDISSKVKLIKADLRDLNLSKKFDLVISLFHVASYCTSNYSLDSFFNCASKHLKRNSLFIFDYWYGPAVLHLKPSNRLKEVELKNHFLKRSCKSYLDSFSSTVEVKYNFEFISKKSNEILKTFKENHLMRYLFPNEIDYFAERNGFEVLKHAVWLKKETPTLEDWNAFSVIKKK
tara:strand:+ start:2272 stop:3057 length:786 start_codon:yes stop_codon:yes gene_type:complete